METSLTTGSPALRALCPARWPVSTNTPPAAVHANLAYPMTSLSPRSRCVSSHIRQ